MDSSPPSRLTLLQQELLTSFFAREQRLFLTGGGALAGFYFAHRDTEDLDLFSPPGLDLSEAVRALSDAAAACGARIAPLQTYGDFRRLNVTRGEESCIVDLVIDRAPMIDTEKARFGPLRVDTLREIAANKICTLLSRSEAKDLVDLQRLIDAGLDLRQALQDAERKDAGADAATLAWILEQIVIGPTARLPGGVEPQSLEQFRIDLIVRLRRIAFEQTQR